MTLFIVIGVLGLVILTASLLLGEVLEGIFDAVDVGLPTPVIGAFLAAFGFGASLILYSTSVGAGLAGLGGLGSGLLVGGAAFALSRALIDMPTDESVRTVDLVGLAATVVTRIPENGLGEVSLSVHGQLQKLSARSSAAVVSGARVKIVAVTSPSSVVVEPETDV